MQKTVSILSSLTSGFCNLSAPLLVMNSEPLGGIQICIIYEMGYLYYVYEHSNDIYSLSFAYGSLTKHSPILKLEFQQKHWGGYSSTVTVPKPHLSALRDWHTQALKGCRACEHFRLFSFLIKSCQRWPWLQLNEKIDAELM